MSRFNPWGVQYPQLKINCFISYVLSLQKLLEAPCTTFLFNSMHHQMSYYLKFVFVPNISTEIIDFDQRPVNGKHLLDNSACKVGPEQLVSYQLIPKRYFHTAYKPPGYKPGFYSKLRLCSIGINRFRLKWLRFPNLEYFSNRFG